MPRPRQKGREHLPENLYAQKRGDRNYFIYRNPITKKVTAIGTDFAIAFEYAVRANRTGVDEAIERGESEHPQQDLLSYEELSNRSIGSASRPGVYFLFQDDDLVYIGKSADIDHRLGQHRNRRAFDFNRVTVFLCDPSEMGRLEARYIRKFRPVFNTVSPLDLGQKAEEVL
jgi:hypothetical protein